MRRMHLLLLVGSIAVGWGSSAARANPQPAPLTIAYGDGVHAYFGGDFQCSYDQLSSVIEAGSTDPRAYYFRGLAALKLGRNDEAEADFQQGASLEAEGRGSVGGQGIGRALERVQGCDRLKLEHYRGRARVAALEHDRTRTRRRYSDIDEPESEVLRRRRPERIKPAEPLAAPQPKAVEAEESAADEPRAEADEATKPAKKPLDTADPFADEPASGK